MSWRMGAWGTACSGLLFTAGALAGRRLTLPTWLLLASWWIGAVIGGVVLVHLSRWELRRERRRALEELSADAARWTPPGDPR